MQTTGYMKNKSTNPVLWTFTEKVKKFNSPPLNQTTFINLKQKKKKTNNSQPSKEKKKKKRSYSKKSSSVQVSIL